MDDFIEQIIKKRFDAADFLIVIAVILGSFAIVVASWVFLPAVMPIVFVAVCIAAYYLITSRNLEFEYSVTNGDITIDKIISRRNRKRVISMDAHDIEAMGKYKKEEHIQKSYDMRIIACENGSGENAWYFTGHHSQKGNVLVVFNPNEKVLKSIKTFLTRQVAVDAFGRN